MTNWYEQLLRLNNIHFLFGNKKNATISIEQIREKWHEGAVKIRREMVEQVNANQRLEGYEPDEHLRQLQERFIANELSTDQMIQLLTEYAREVQQAGANPETK